MSDDDATLTQMQARLGHLDAGMREIRDELRAMHHTLGEERREMSRSFATVRELRAWVGVLGALIVSSGLLNWLRH
jgi:hypothetical protein